MEEVEKVFSPSSLLSVGFSPVLNFDLKLSQVCVLLGFVIALIFLIFFFFS